MKTLPKLSLALSLLGLLVMTGCRPSRVYADKRKVYREERETLPPPAPPARIYSSYRLIISPTPGFVMNRHPDGRFYHRNEAGYLYWKGYDNRFYLDRSYLNRVRYSEWEYNEWKRFYRSNNSSRNRRY